MMPSFSEGAWTSFEELPEDLQMKLGQLSCDAPKIREGSQKGGAGALYWVSNDALMGI